MWQFIYDGEALFVTNMFDVDGGETDNVDDVMSVVAKFPSGMWLAALLSEGTLVRGRLN